jgi:hypothetical protein
VREPALMPLLLKVVEFLNFYCEKATTAMSLSHNPKPQATPGRVALRETIVRVTLLLLAHRHCYRHHHHTMLHYNSPSRHLQHRGTGHHPFFRRAASSLLLTQRLDVQSPKVTRVYTPALSQPDRRIMPAATNLCRKSRRR